MGLALVDQLSGMAGERFGQLDRRRPQAHGDSASADVDVAGAEPADLVERLRVDDHERAGEAEPTVDASPVEEVARERPTPLVGERCVRRVVLAGGDRETRHGTASHSPTGEPREGVGRAAGPPGCPVVEVNLSAGRQVVTPLGEVVAELRSRLEPGAGRGADRLGHRPALGPVVHGSQDLPAHPGAKHLDVVVIGDGGDASVAPALGGSKDDVSLRERAGGGEQTLEVPDGADTELRRQGVDHVVRESDVAGRDPSQRQDGAALEQPVDRRSRVIGGGESVEQRGKSVACSRRLVAEQFREAAAQGAARAAAALVEEVLDAAVAAHVGGRLPGAVRAHLHIESRVVA